MDKYTHCQKASHTGTGTTNHIHQPSIPVSIAIIIWRTSWCIPSWSAWQQWQWSGSDEFECPNMHVLVLLYYTCWLRLKVLFNTGQLQNIDHCPTQTLN